ncbi:MAG: hypothetical protein ACRD4Q_09885 [Candidatus Acidiferrales bacterium]
MKAQISNHAKTRVRQRGMKDNDLDFVLAYGTPVSGGVFFSSKDYVQVERDAKRQIKSAERLRDVFIACSDDGCVLTTFRANRQQQHRFLHE